MCDFAMHMLDRNAFFAVERCWKRCLQAEISFITEYC